MSGPEDLVDNTIQAEPAAFGLLSPAATVITDNGKHWTNRIDWWTLNTDAQLRLSSINSAATGAYASTSIGYPQFRSAIPFDIEADFQCSTVAFDVLDYEAVAKVQLELGQQKAVEFELWKGAIAQQESALWVSGDHGGDTYPNKWLASTDAIDVTPSPGTAVKLKYGLALLEKALGDDGVGVQGVIHATREVVSALGVNLKEENDTLFTILGNKVVAGSGYDGTGPTGAQPSGAGTAWMYATGPVAVRLGPVTATPDDRSQAVDTSINTVHVYSSRPAAVVWDSRSHYAVLVDLALDYA